jgi:hypothetical protein
MSTKRKLHMEFKHVVGWGDLFSYCFTKVAFFRFTKSLWMKVPCIFFVI